MSVTVERGTPSTTRLRPIECQVCGLKLRGSFGPLERAGMPEHCGLPMTWTHPADGYRSASPYDCPAVAELESAHDRRLARESSSRGLGLKRSTVGQCGGCRKPITATNELCGCGFANDLRGRRNLGGYGEPAGAATGMPF